MLFRCMMILLLLMISVMPAWAEEKDASSDLITEFRQKYYQRVNESPLSKLIVTAEDWREDNTYYVRHTIANPTNEKIEKKLTRIQVSYDTHNQKKTTSYHQYVDTISDLVIAPNETITVTFPLSLSANDPIELIEHEHTLWEFTDRSYIDIVNAPTSTDFHIEPVFSPTDGLAISITNNSSDTTITEMCDINLSAYFRKISDGKTARFNYCSSDTFPLTIKPHETMTVPISKQYLPNADDLSLNKFYLTTRLNDSLYRSEKDPSAPPPSHGMSSYRLVPKLEYIPPFTWTQNPLKGTGTFEIDGDNLTCYLQIKNPKDKTVTLAKPMIRSLFTYYDKNHLLQAKHIECMLPDEASFAPNEERFYTFSVTLPADHFVQYPFIEWLFPSSQNGSPYLLTESYKPLSPKEKTRYTDLGAASFMPLRGLTESFYLGMGFPTNRIMLIFLLNSNHQ